MGKNNTTSTLEHILSPDSEQEISRSEFPWISDIKINSVQFLKTRGFPTLKNEKWKLCLITLIK